MGCKGMNFEFGTTFEDIAHAAKEFGEKMREMGPDLGARWDEYCSSGGQAHRPGQEWRGWEGFSSHFYPAVNSYPTRDGGMVLEFALPGIDQSSVTITFVGDYLVLSAKAAPASGESGEEPRFRHRGFAPRDIDRKRYYVPAADYAQDQATAVHKNGVLTVTVPPKEPEGGGIKVEIVKEGN
jgi:HSP20 family molecular chaperone IbpA